MRRSMRRLCSCNSVSPPPPLPPRPPGVLAPRPPRSLHMHSSSLPDRKTIPKISCMSLRSRESQSHVHCVACPDKFQQPRDIIIMYKRLHLLTYEAFHIWSHFALRLPKKIDIAVGMAAQIDNGCCNYMAGIIPGTDNLHFSCSPKSFPQSSFRVNCAHKPGGLILERSHLHLKSVMLESALLRGAIICANHISHVPMRLPPGECIKWAAHHVFPHFVLLHSTMAVRASMTVSHVNAT